MSFKQGGRLLFYHDNQLPSTEMKVKIYSQYGFSFTRVAKAGHTTIQLTILVIMYFNIRTEKCITKRKKMVYCCHKKEKKKKKIWEI